jgi:hypothetical protein
MVDLKPQIEKVLAEHERDFMLSEESAQTYDGEKGVQFVRDLRKEFWFIRTHLVEPGSP